MSLILLRIKTSRKKSPVVIHDPNCGPIKTFILAKCCLKGSDSEAGWARERPQNFGVMGWHRRGQLLQATVMRVCTPQPRRRVIRRKSSLTELSQEKHRRPAGRSPGPPQARWVVATLLPITAGQLSPVGTAGEGNASVSARRGGYLPHPVKLQAHWLECVQNDSLLQGPSLFSGDRLASAVKQEYMATSQPVGPALGQSWGEPYEEGRMGMQTPAGSTCVRGNFKMSREMHALLVWLQGCSWLSNTFLLEGRLSRVLPASLYS